MTQPPGAPEPRPRGDGDLVPVISAYGAFRLLLYLLAGWSLFAGFALITGFAALSYEDGTASKVAGLHMMILAPIYALIGWRREDYRLLIWLPYAGLLALILPALWQLVVDQEVDAPLILVVSLIFFALFVYLWLSSSNPTDFFLPDEEVEEEEDHDEADDDDEALSTRDAATSERARRYRRN